MKLNFIFAPVFTGIRRVLTEDKVFIRSDDSDEYQAPSEMMTNVASSAVAQVVRMQDSYPPKKSGRGFKAKKKSCIFNLNGEVAQVVRAQDS